MTGGTDGRPRVLLLTTHPIDGPGADAAIAVGLARELPGFAFTWFGRVGTPPAAPGTKVSVLSAAGTPGVAERLQVALRVPGLVGRVDLVHAVMTVGPTHAAWSRSALAPRGRPVLLTVPGVVSPGCLRGARPLGTAVALSPVTAALLRDAGYRDVRVVPPGIDLARWRRAPRPAGPRPVLFFAGHTDRDGGVGEAIAVAAGVRRAGVPVRLVLALRTRAGQREAAQLRAVAAHARAAGLDDVAVHGRVASMPDALAAADVVLFTPARLDGGKADVPLVLLEALATGRPVVATRLPQLAALARATVQVPPRAVAEAVDAVRSLLADRAAWQDWADRGRAAVEEDFGREAMSHRYAALYAELLAARPPAAG